MTKTLHPADIADRQKIATATHFNVHLRFGPHDKTNEQAETLPQAVKVADRLAAAHKGKVPMIYAITPEKFTVLVPKDMVAAARRGSDEPEALTGAQIEQITAIITGEGRKRANSKAAAAKRFIKVATEAGVKRAADLIGGPFDMAEHVIREHVAGRHMSIAEVQLMRSEVDEVSADDIEAAAEFHDAVVANGGTNDGMGGKIADTKQKTGKRAAQLEAARRGELPAAPDFTAPTHARFRKKLAEIVAFVEAGDIASLKAIVINPVSSSPKAMDKYRNLAVMALEAKAAAE